MLMRGSVGAQVPGTPMSMEETMERMAARAANL